jgi:hypothetical protein
MSSRKGNHFLQAHSKTTFCHIFSPEGHCIFSLISSSMSDTEQNLWLSIKCLKNPLLFRIKVGLDSQTRALVKRGGHIHSYIHFPPCGIIVGPVVFECEKNLECKTHGRKSDIITGTATCEYAVGNTSSQNSPWKNSVAKCEPVQCRLSCRSSRFHQTNGKSVLVNWRDYCSRSFVFISGMVFVTEWGENSDCSSILKRTRKGNIFAIKAIWWTFSEDYFAIILLYVRCCNNMEELGWTTSYIPTDISYSYIIWIVSLSLDLFFTTVLIK